MPPTIQSNGRPEGRSRAGAAAGEKRSELVCRVKYNNTLPDIPFDPKFIVYPFEPQRYVQYNPTSLERNYKFELLTEHDLGVTIDLINPDTYRINPNAYLDPEDENLLDDESNAPVDAKRSRHQNKNVSWLRRTEYISTEYNRFVQSAQKAEARVGYSIKKQLKEEVLYKDRDSQIKAIVDTFEQSKKPIEQHYSKPGVVAVDVLPLFPDFEMWKQPCAQVIFDTDPALKDKSLAEQNEEMSKAMIRGMVDEHGEQFVAYFLPSTETLEKNKRDLEMGVEYEEGEEYDYLLSGEYNWNVKNKASRGYEENYFFVLKDDGIYYNELETRVRLSKRRKIGATASRAKSRLVVKHRPMTEQELAAQDARVMMLEPPGEEDEELDNRLMNESRYDEDRNNRNEGGDSPARSDASSTGSRRSRKRRASGALSEASHHSGSPRGSREGSPAGSDRSRARSGSGSPARSGSGSPAGSRAGSPARSGSGSPARSGSGSPAGSRAGSPARAGAGSPARSGSGSPARSGSGSPAGSRAGSPARSGSGSPPGSPARSGSGSPAGSRAGSPARSGSGSPPGSPARSGSGSPAGSPARSGSGSPARSGSEPGSEPASPAGSGPGSPAGSEAGSPPGSPARSGSEAGSPAGSEAGSPAGSEAGSPPGSPAGSGYEEDGGGSDDERFRNEEAEIFGSDSD